MLLLENTKYNKKYKCPYCNLRLPRDKFTRHLEDKHEDCIPEGYTPSRVMFNWINYKNIDHVGKCVMCGSPVEWNENTCRYNRICNKPECMNKYKEQVRSRIKKIYGTENLAQDPQHQEKMLKGRRISGTYKFSDGGEHSYTGSYERKTLEFLDKVMNYKSEEVETPGPVIEYEYNGQKHFWILDIYIPIYNLAIECKDGSTNPNNREMKEYREKQIAKEEAMAKLNKYNYLRLTNNEFNQLMSMLAELKLQMEDNKILIRIHENMFAGIAGMMPMKDWNDPDNVYILNILKNNIFASTAISESVELDRLIVQDSNGFIHETTSDFLKNAKYSIYVIKNAKAKYNKIVESIGNKETSNYILETLFNRSVYTSDEWICNENVHKIFDYYEYLKCTNEISRASIGNAIGMRVLENTLDSPVYLNKGFNGYYYENAYTTLRTPEMPKNKLNDIYYYIIKTGVLV